MPDPTFADPTLTFDDNSVTFGGLRIEGNVGSFVAAPAILAGVVRQKISVSGGFVAAPAILHGSGGNVVSASGAFAAAPASLAGVVAPTIQVSGAPTFAPASLAGEASQVIPVTGGFLAGAPSFAAFAPTQSDLILAPTTIPSLPYVLSGTLTHFLPGELVTFHLDDPAGPELVGSVTLDGGYGTNYGFDYGYETGRILVTVTLPEGTLNGSHVIYAVGDLGSVASATITLLVLPTVALAIASITFPYKAEATVILEGQGANVIETQVGDTPRFACRFMADGVSADPSTITLLLKTPAGTVTTHTHPVGVTRESTGLYSRPVLLTLEGTWLYRWVGTGAVPTADEGELKVRRSQFV